MKRVYSMGPSPSGQFIRLNVESYGRDAGGPPSLFFDLFVAEEDGPHEPLASGMAHPRLSLFFPEDHDEILDEEVLTLAWALPKVLDLLQSAKKEMGL